MRRATVLSLLLASSTFAQTDTRFVNADGSGLSAICIAAITSREAMYATAAELGTAFDAAFASRLDPALRRRARQLLLRLPWST